MMGIIDFKNAGKNLILREAAKLSDRISDGAFRKDIVETNYNLGVVKGMRAAAQLLDESFGKAQKAALSRGE